MWVTLPRRRGRPPKAGGAKVGLSLRLPPDLKADADAIAKVRNETLTDVIEAALDRYVARHRRLLNPETPAH
jgi:hypothetical protein